MRPDANDEEQVDNSSRNLIDKTERAGAEVELTPVPDNSDKQKVAAEVPAQDAEEK